ncbi:hypothetical protein TNCV_1526901 [Trichonephila clavipes]|nr:hypothetical protein TNCV_1526901 [Trichonephila clavipes]
MWNRWVQDSNMERRAGSQRPLSLAFEKPQCYPHGLNGSCSHVTSPESRIKVVCKTTSICMNSSNMFAEAWTLSSETMAVATLHAESQTLSMV